MNLNAAVSASPGRGLLPVFLVSLASVNSAEKEQLGHPKVSSELSGTEGRLHEMSRRKLGSRPQHLSAIQGKARCAGDFCGSRRL